MGYCLYRPQPFEAGPGAESVRSVADSCWSRIKGRDKVELKLGCGNYDPQTPPSTLDSISLKDYPDRLLGGFSYGASWIVGRIRTMEAWTGRVDPSCSRPRPKSCVAYFPIPLPAHLRLLWLSDSPAFRARSIAGFRLAQPAPGRRMALASNRGNAREPLVESASGRNQRGSFRSTQ